MEMEQTQFFSVFLLWSSRQEDKKICFLKMVCRPFDVCCLLRSVCVYVCKVLCDDVMKADIDAVIADLLQLYDMEAKCI